MECIICCLCSLLCAVCCVWAVRGARRLSGRNTPEEVWSEADDALSRDIAAMLAYTGPKKEEERDGDA
ncbi:MAG TPA: hypothetical protein IAA32_06925 [Candidatus Butyricicoccus stercorigallinarum]|nr:hypothetical protein [Candidatus Butyricicoccus stercorigallinarum]